MQALAIPGTLSLSIISGALYGAFNGWILVAVTSTTGACCSFALSSVLGRRAVAALWPDKLDAFAKEVQKNRKGDLLLYIIFLRMTPILPNVFINVASPIVGVPLAPFFFGESALTWW